jgi:hypothetical protein
LSPIFVVAQVTPPGIFVLTSVPQSTSRSQQCFSPLNLRQNFALPLLKFLSLPLESSGQIFFAAAVFCSYRFWISPSRALPELLLALGCLPPRVLGISPSPGLDVFCRCFCCCSIQDFTVQAP